MMSQIRDRDANRRGALLLLVLTALTMFMMIGTLMLVIATRTRTSARAFSDAANSISADSLQARTLLDEALMVLLRGSKGPLPAELKESVLEDRYGTDILSGTAASVRPMTAGPLQGQPAVLEVSLQGIKDSQGQPPQHPCDLNGRIITFKPDPNDGDVASYRILRTIGQGNSFTAYLANLPTSRSPVLPRKACEVLINGREYMVSGTSTAIEAYDSFDKDPWLARIPLENSEPITSGSIRPSFGPDIPLATGSATGLSGTAAARLACDNDNDGFVDGIWISGSTGFLASRPSPLGGRLSYEVSYLVLDLDGRINLNAHGSLTPVLTATSWKASVADQDISDVPVGLGYGPADVDASRIVASGSAAKGMPGYPGHWSNVVIAGTSISGSSSQRRTTPTIGLPVDGRYGLEASGRRVPGIEGSTAPPPTRWSLNGASPTDLKVRIKAFVTSTSSGVPSLVFYTPDASVSDFVESPYELRLDADGPRVMQSAQRGTQGGSSTGGQNTGYAADNPFTVGELERILRPFDSDASALPARLAAILDDQSERNRLVVTTDSWDTTAICGDAMTRIRDYLRRFPVPSAASSSLGTGNAEVYDAMSPDVTAGLRFDINRPLEYPSLQAASIPKVKDRFCRHLFTLLVALGQPASKQTAQWVANVCDFRDADSTMTGFRYDATPENGWTSGADSVFGAERPEVVITESLAWNDVLTGMSGLAVVLYHPWDAKMVSLSGTTPTEVLDPNLAVDVASKPNVLDLAKKVGSSSDSVWRLRIVSGDATLSTIGLAGIISGSDTRLQLAPNSYACVQSVTTGASVPSITVSTFLPPPAGAGGGKVVIERLANPAKALNEDSSADDYNPYVAVDEALLEVAIAKDSATKRQRNPMSFWKQAWRDAAGVPGPYDAPAPWLHWPNRPFVGVGELALVPAGDANGMLSAMASPSLALDPTSLVLDACTVSSRFTGSDVRIGQVNANGDCSLLDTVVSSEEICTTQMPRWREPGRVNVNTVVSNTGNALAVLDHAVWQATAGTAAASINNGRSPFDALGGGAAADSMTKLLALGGGAGTMYLEPEDQAAPPRKNDDFFRYATAIRLSNVATTRSSMFAVWITLKTTDSSPGASGPSYRRLFAIIDRSIPAGFSRGENLNVRDTVRLQRFLD
jgi:hypothetical protein